MSKYRLIYLPLFQEDLRNAAVYISTVLNNPEAADRLVDLVAAHTPSIAAQAA